MFKRKIFDQLITHLPQKEFSIVSGARQTGKSTLLRQLEGYCKINNIPAIFLNLEQKSILSELDENPLNLLKFLYITNERVVVFIDEIQYLKDASNFLKLIFDEHVEHVKIIASGSSAFYMNKGFRDSLAGRKKIFYLPTCSFDEYLGLNGKDELLADKNLLMKGSGRRSTLITYLQLEWENYMIYGGYPAVVTEPDKNEKIERLRELRDSFIKRDILESGIINETAFYNLLSIFAGQSGNLVNSNELASTLRIKHDTVSSYLGIMQRCFHIALIKPFFKNLRNELIKMPKVYMLDTGLRNCLLSNFQPITHRSDKGELWENVFFRVLSDKYGFDAIHFWRTNAGNEVDFILPFIDEPKAIETKYDKNQMKFSKYKLFRNTYPELPLSFVWLHPFNEEFFRRTFV